MKVFTKPPMVKDESEIFIEDVNTLVKNSYPEYEGQHPIFKKFGTRTGGLYDTWLYSKDWELLDEVEKWKYVAFCARYWEEQYRYWYDRLQYEEYKNYLKKWSEKDPDFLNTLKDLENQELKKSH